MNLMAEYLPTCPKLDTIYIYLLHFKSLTSKVDPLLVHIHLGQPSPFCAIAAEATGLERCCGLHQ